MKECERFHVIASLQLDGELAPAHAETLRTHAAACPDCRAYAAGLRRVAAQLRAVSAAGSQIPGNAFRQ